MPPRPGVRGPARAESGRSASARASTPPAGRPEARARLYTARVPLEGLEAAAAALPGPLAEAALRHSLVVVEQVAAPPSPGPADGSTEEVTTVVAFDFLPAAGRDPAAVLTLLAGGEVAGRLRERALPRGVPRARAAFRPQFEGDGPEGADCLARARQFNREVWRDRRLRLAGRNCHDYSRALLRYLRRPP